MKNSIYNPELSVVMAAYNAEKYLDTAIKSILSQSFTDFEFIIVNDGSNDNTENIIMYHAKRDERVIYLRNIVNVGQSMSWNKAIEMARGKFIVRMDADDVSLPTRFRQQYDYMKLHSEVGVLGTYFYMLNENKKNIRREMTSSIADGEPPIHHPTVFIRKELFKENGYYDPSYDGAEDTELWYRFFMNGIQFANIDQYLLLYRIHKNNVSIKKMRKQVYLLFKINLIAIFKYKIKFSIRGYIRTAELFLYFIYLSSRLNTIFRNSKIR